MIFWAAFFSGAFCVPQRLLSAEQARNNTFTYNLTSTNEDRALLALESSPFNVKYASIALNETYPNIVYYGLGLLKGVLTIKLDAFMTKNETSTAGEENEVAKESENTLQPPPKVVMNATLTPELLFEADASGQPIANSTFIRFNDTASGWGPMGTGILSVQNLTMAPPELTADRNATIISILWTGPQRDSRGSNTTVQFNVFLAPGIAAMGRMMSVGAAGNMTDLRNITGMIAAVLVSNYPFTNGTTSNRLVLRNILRINQTVYNVDQIVAQPPLNQSVPVFGNITEEVFVSRNVLNLNTNTSTAVEEAIVNGSGEAGDREDRPVLILEGIAVNLATIQSVVEEQAQENSASRGRVHAAVPMFAVMAVLFLLFL